MSETNPWWGHFEVDNGRSGRWRLGPLELGLNRKPGEWEVIHRNGADSMAEFCDVETNLAPVTSEPDHEILRFGSEEHGTGITVEPRLADRPVVARPERPFFLVAGGVVHVYVSTPLSVHVGIHERPDTLLELPTFRMSDTWFGPDTMEGELCYSVHTAARLHVEDMPLRRHRAVTELRVENRGHDPLLLERVKIPLPILSLFVSAQGWLWTGAVSVVRQESGAAVRVQLARRAPDCAGPTTLVAGPRRKESRNAFERAVHGLFG